MTHRKPNIVTFTGGLWSPSKTKSVALAISAAVAERVNGTQQLFEAGSLVQEIGTTLTPEIT